MCNILLQLLYSYFIKYANNTILAQIQIQIVQ